MGKVDARKGVTWLPCRESALPFPYRKTLPRPPRQPVTARNLGPQSVALAPPSPVGFCASPGGLDEGLAARTPHLHSGVTELGAATLRGVRSANVDAAVCEDCLEESQ